MKKTITLIVTSLICASAFAQSGSLDNTFGTGGKVITAVGSSHDYGNSVAIQSDGKIVVAGGTSNGAVSDFVVVRYNANGTLDNTFGSGGKVTTDFASDDDVANSIAIQSNGKILVAGYSKSLGNKNFAVVRYNADGTLDNTFGSSGKITTDLGGNQDYASSIAIQTDGKIVVTGPAYNSNTNWNFAVVRYNTDGTLDNTFNFGGMLTLDFSNSYDFSYSVAIQADGKILLAGGAAVPSRDFALARYNSDGTLDNTFGSAGKVTTAVGTGDDGGNSVAIQADGKIVLVGNNGTANTPASDFAVVRYNSDGSLDNTFGSGGIAVTDLTADDDLAKSVALQADGKILVAGRSKKGSNSDFAVVRYNVNGSLDNTFDSDGKVLTAVGDSTDNGNAIAIQSDGKILVVGLSSNGTNNDIALVRYKGDNGTGISSLLISKNIDVHPNPSADGIFNVKFNSVKSGRFTVSNLLGEMVYNGSIAAANGNHTLNLNHLCAGIYLLQIADGTDVSTQKIVIQK